MADPVSVDRILTFKCVLQTAVLPAGNVSRSIFQGGRALDQPITIVLPVHNAERQLRSNVRDILDVTTTGTREIRVVIVDDCSTDDTYETACEIARRYPQITVMRQAMRKGLGTILAMIRNRVSAERVLMHDGVSAINTKELQQILQTPTNQDDALEQAGTARMPIAESTGSRRFPSVRAGQNRMEQAHRAVSSFRWIKLDQLLVPRRRPTVGLPTTVSINPLTAAAPGIGLQTPS